MASPWRCWPPRWRVRSNMASWPEIRYGKFSSRRLRLSASNASHRKRACRTVLMNHLLTTMALIIGALSGGVSAQTTPYTRPASPRAKLNFDLNWKFIREDVARAEAPGFDDSAWSTISTPHSFNDVDSFRQIISH